jgi:hypothetical protein
VRNALSCERLPTQAWLFPALVLRFTSPLVAAVQGVAIAARTSESTNAVGASSDPNWQTNWVFLSAFVDVCANGSVISWREKFEAFRRAWTSERVIIGRWVVSAGGGGSDTIVVGLQQTGIEYLHIEKGSRFCRHDFEAFFQFCEKDALSSFLGWTTALDP